MYLCRIALLALGLCLSGVRAFAMGESEVLRYPVSEASDGSLTVVAVGGKPESMPLPPNSRDGYRFSWQGSFYELVTYSSGRYAVVSFDPYQKGKALGHSLYLKSRSESSSPVPEWVSDDRRLLTGLPQFSGQIALRYSKASMASTKKLTAGQILKDTIQPFVLSGIASPSDSDMAAASAIAADMASALAPKSLLSTYWMEFWKTDPSARPKDMDFISVRKVYGLVVVPEAEYSKALLGIFTALESGKSPQYLSPNSSLLLEALAGLSAGKQGRSGTAQTSPPPAPPQGPARSDLIQDLPEARTLRPDAVAVVIGNRSYRTTGVPPSDLAGSDADLVRTYLTKTLGFRGENVINLADASRVDLDRIFGTAAAPEGQLFERVKSGSSDVFVYYRGHGALSRDGKDAYLLPVDCDPESVRQDGYPLDLLFGNLAKVPFRTLTVVLDATFSGEAWGGSETADGLAEPLSGQRAAIFLSASGGQTALPYPDKGNTLFTYCFVKGMADLSKVPGGAVTAGGIFAYVRERVGALALGLHGRRQVPVFTGDPDLVILDSR